ncbi:hypothetical protein [Pseudoduganella sp. RAF53_2]|uniref:hypothetical protein n=1 Tax=unclassified Pseudoduganella TaxID=2637179 RepID=UPI003F960B45
MKPRHIAMGAALLVAAGLVLFGDKTPSSSVVESADRAPAKHTGPTSAASGQGAAATAATAGAGASAAAASPAGPASAPTLARATGGADKQPVAILPLIPRAQLIGEAGDGSFKSADGVFGGQTWNPPPPPPPPPVQAPPPPPPTAPPLPFAVIGKAVADGQWEVYLSRGADQTYVVRKSTVIDGMYRVDNIAPPTMTMTYLPMNQVQQLNIGVIE